MYNTADIYDPGSQNVRRVFVSFPGPYPDPVMPVPFANVRDNVPRVGDSPDSNQTPIQGIVDSKNLLWAKPSRWYWTNGEKSQPSDIRLKESDQDAAVAGLGTGYLAVRDTLSSVPAGSNSVQDYF